MSQTRPDGGAPAIEAGTAHARRDDGPSVFLRNEDDVEHTIDVRVAAGDRLLAETTRRVESDGRSTVDGAWTASGTVRIELWADHGCAASVSLDPASPEGPPTPEFIVRSDSIVVAGVH